MKFLKGLPPQKLLISANVFELVGENPRLGKQSRVGPLHQLFLQSFLKAQLIAQRYFHALKIPFKSVLLATVKIDGNSEQKRQFLTRLTLLNRQK